MSTEAQSQIVQRAYQIWEQEGRPEGRALDHWLRAEAEFGAPAKPAKRSASAAKSGKVSAKNTGRKVTRAARK